MITTDLRRACVCSTLRSMVCLDILTAANIPARIAIFDFDRNIDTCTQCLIPSVSTQLEEKIWDQISYPICGERHSSNDIQALADKATRERQDPLYFNFGISIELS